jgi:hypothetical protein
MKPEKRKIARNFLIAALSVIVLISIVAVILIARTWGRTQLQIDIHQNKKIIHLSNFAEPPQFAIWLENPVSGELRSVFVTHRAGTGDWEGKANVPVALPLWFKLFKTNKPENGKKIPEMAISGATPKNDLFSVRVEVPPGSDWIMWIEMNLAGDFNDSYPEVDLKTLREDEFSNGQPAIIYKALIKAIEGKSYKPDLVLQSTWEKGSVITGPVSDGITTARDVFDEMNISVIKPKPKLIDKTRIREN